MPAAQQPGERGSGRLHAGPGNGYHHIGTGTAPAPATADAPACDPAGEGAVTHACAARCQKEGSLDARQRALAQSLAQGAPKPETLQPLPLELPFAHARAHISRTAEAAGHTANASS